jgi:hypothetical protein
MHNNCLTFHCCFLNHPDALSNFHLDILTVITIACFSTVSSYHYHNCPPLDHALSLINLLATSAADLKSRLLFFFP